jgi:peptide/nickel transport system substrate-binding protein
MKNLPTTVITGLQQAIQNKYLTKAELASFNPYAYSPKKATQILDSLHFKRAASGWMMPNGKPFTLSLIAPSGYSGEVLSTTEAASELTQFGIKTTATAVEQPGFWTYQSKGQYDISWGWGGWWVFNPLQTFYDDLVNQNFTPNQPGYVGMGFGPAVQVPGIGHVNLADNLTAALKITSPARIRQLSLDYARLVNQQLPFIPYADKRLAIWYSSQNYTDWPSPNSYLWNQVGGNAPGALALMMMNGYIRPR